MSAADGGDVGFVGWSWTGGNHQKNDAGVEFIFQPNAPVPASESSQSSARHDREKIAHSLILRDG